MLFSLLSDEEILIELGRRIEAIRIENKLTEEELSEKGGVPRSAIYRIKKGEGISLVNFIKILKGLNRIDKLDILFKEAQSSIQTNKQTKLKRIYKKRSHKHNEDFVWGEDKK